MSAEHTCCASRSLACSRDLHPGLLTFRACLAQNKARLPIQ